MRTITKSQRLQIIGLLTLAEKHMNALEDLQAALLEITLEIDGETGHTSDAIYDSSRRDADELLKRLEIKVRGR
jgi:hypothetical protein